MFKGREWFRTGDAGLLQGHRGILLSRAYIPTSDCLPSLFSLPEWPHYLPASLQPASHSSVAAACVTPSGYGCTGTATSVVAGNCTSATCSAGYSGAPTIPDCTSAGGTWAFTGACTGESGCLCECIVTGEGIYCNLCCRSGPCFVARVTFYLFPLIPLSCPPPLLSQYLHHPLCRLCLHRRRNDRLCWCLHCHYLRS